MKRHCHSKNTWGTGVQFNVKSMIIIAGIAMMLFFTTYWFVQGMNRSGKVIATVNGEPIVREEFEQRMQLYRGEVQSYFIINMRFKTARIFGLPIMMAKIRSSC